MRFLVDTCVAIWYFEGSDKIGVNMQDLLSDPKNEVYVSDVSVLEIVIKYTLGKLPLPSAPSELLPTLAEKHAFATLPLFQEAIFQLESLPPLHRDPFDRLLLAQSMEHGLTLVTPDPKIRQYSVPTMWA